MPPPKTIQDIITNKCEWAIGTFVNDLFKGIDMNKKMAFFAVLTFALIIVFGLAGCNKDKPVAPPETPDAADTSEAAETPPAIKLDSESAEEIMKDVGPEMPKDMSDMLTQLLADAEKDAATQTMCPVMGGEIDENIFVEYQGKKIYFCCPPCKEKFNADPEQYLSKLPQFKK